MIEEVDKATLRETKTEELRTYPCIIIKRVYISVRNGFIDSGEDGLGTDHPPSCSSLRRGLELAKEPILLATTHHRAPCVIRYLVYVMCIPVKIGDRSIVLTSVKHDEIKQCADRKASPNSQVVVHFLDRISIAFWNRATCLGCRDS